MARSVTVIPARSQKVRTGHKAVQEKKIRVAAYCRVSTDQEDQLHSFEAQVEYYTKYINEHENYEMAGIYADEGISGTNTKKREQFKKMIADCEGGKIDLVITKSISRFARNTQDCLAYSRKLKNLGIGIIFEKENINTLDSTGELLFTILSSLAQDESRNISENCKWGIRTKFKNGEMHLNTFKFLGYDKDENGKLVINKEQAKTVRRIYRDFLIGINPAQIAKELTEEKVPGCLGQTKWYPSTVIGILKQEKHMGDALLQKTYTADFLTKRQVKNNGEMHLNTFKFLGYDKDETGKLVINKEQAKTVRRIYRDFLIGINPAQIAKELTEEKVPGCLGQTKWYPSTVIGILKQEKHMGDALLQKTYTADFLTKRQVKNNGEIAQVYVKDSHKGIIDKQTWNAVQEEFDRREKFMEAHGTDRYSYGADCMPFCEKVFCGECKSLFTRHSWKSRGIVQWQCKNHRKDGKVACTNAYVDNADLENGFVKAFNRLVTDRDKHMERWQQMKSDGTPLEKIRAGQMMEAVGNEPLTRFVPEIAQLVLCEVTVLGAKKYEFFFLEGSRVKVSV